MDQEHRSAPQITITDPNHPAEPVDVLGAGSEREPWRPSRRLRTVSAVVVVVLTIVLVPALVLHHRSVQRAADRAAVAQVDLAVPDGEQGGVFGDGTDTSPSLSLVNHGPHTLRVVGVSVDRDGYAHQKADLTLSPGDQSTLPIAIEKTCPARLGSSGPGGVLVDVVTTTGARTTVRIPTLTTLWSQNYLVAVKTSCRLYDAYESVVTEVGSVLPGVKALRVVAELHNRAKAERELLAVHAPPGLTVHVDKRRPSVVPQEGGPPLELTLDITVTSCGQARALFFPTEPPTDVIVNPVPHSAVTLDANSGGLASGARGGFTELSFDVRGDGATATVPMLTAGEIETELQDLVRSTCPG